MSLGRLARMVVLCAVGVAAAALAIIGAVACCSSPAAPGPAEQELERVHREVTADGLVTVQEAARLAEALGPALAELRELREASRGPALPGLPELLAVIGAAVGIAVPTVNVYRNHNLPGTTRAPRS